MSPEQALGQGDVDRRTDLYAFGAMLFQMVTGAPPYDGESSQEIVGKHLADPIPAAMDRNAALPRWLSDVIVTCLAKRANDRYPTAAAVLDALTQGRASGPQKMEKAGAVADRVRGEEKTVAMPSSGERAASTPRKSKAPILVVAAFTLLLGGGVGGYFYLNVPVTFENHLVLPVKLQWDGREAATVAPGGSFAQRVK